MSRSVRKTIGEPELPQGARSELARRPATNEFKRRQVMTMESLNERLTAFRIKGESSRDPAVTALMHRATDELRASGILAGVPSVGDAAPLFARPDLDGATVHLQTLLERGPTIVSFFRGRW